MSSCSNSNNSSCNSSCSCSPSSSSDSHLKIEKTMDEIIIEESICPYHNIRHKIKNDIFDHSGCKKHGHCLNPIQCTLFKTCPMHQNGANMFLAWSCLS